MSELGQRIARARRGSSLTQLVLGRMLGVDSVTVSRWERGITQPSLRTLEEISKITGVPLSEFVAGDGAPNVILDELKALREDVRELKDILTPRLERLSL